jgi:hypothetical protein
VNVETRRVLDYSRQLHCFATPSNGSHWPDSKGSFKCTRVIKEKKSWETSLSEEDTMATDAGAGPDVTAFERIGAPNVPYPPYNQLDMQIAGLRAQLMVAEEQLRRTEDMLRRARGTGAEGG